MAYLAPARISFALPSSIFLILRLSISLPSSPHMNAQKSFLPAKLKTAQLYIEHSQPKDVYLYSPNEVYMSLRGGASADHHPRSSKKKKKKKKNNKKVIEKEISSNKDLSDHLKRDIAENMGRVIRKSKDQLLSDPVPSLRRIHTLHSLSVGLGNSSPPRGSGFQRSSSPGSSESHGSIPLSLPAILSNYLLRSHGNAYPLQTIASILSVFYAAAALRTVDPASSTSLFRRCNAAALARHASGLVGAVVLAARGIRGDLLTDEEGGRRSPPEGLSRVRKRMEALAGDAVGQYLFACSVMVLWAGCADVKWMVRGISMTVLLTPVFVRETVNVMWTVGDILGILAYAEEIEEDGDDDLVEKKSGNRSGWRWMQLLLKVVDGSLGLVLGPMTWRKMDVVERQRVLAKLVRRFSLVAELGTAGILITDAIQSLIPIIMPSPQEKLLVPFSIIVQKLICARLYVNFLQAKSRSVSDLAKTLTGLEKIKTST